MGSGTLIEPFAIAEIYCDGVEHTVIDGMMTATAYRIIATRDGQERIAVARLVLKVDNALHSMTDAAQAISAPLVPDNVRRIGRH